MQGCAADPIYVKGEVFTYVGLPQNLKDLNRGLRSTPVLPGTFSREREQGLISGSGTSQFSVPRSLCSLRDMGNRCSRSLPMFPTKDLCSLPKNCENGYLAHKKAPLP